MKQTILKFKVDKFSDNVSHKHKFESVTIPQSIPLELFREYSEKILRERFKGFYVYFDHNFMEISIWREKQD